MSWPSGPAPGRIDVGQDIPADVGGKFRVLIHGLSASFPGAFEAAEVLDVVRIRGRANFVAGQ